MWEEWFQIELSVPKLSGAKQKEFQMQFHQELSEDRRFISKLAALVSPDGKVSPVILDLDLIWEGAPTEPGELGRVLEHVHGPHRLAFEAYLSDKVRKLFYLTIWKPFQQRSLWPGHYSSMGQNLGMVWGTGRQRSLLSYTRAASLFHWRLRQLMELSLPSQSAALDWMSLAKEALPNAMPLTPEERVSINEFFWSHFK